MNREIKFRFFGWKWSDHSGQTKPQMFDWDLDCFHLGWHEGKVAVYSCETGDGYYGAAGSCEHHKELIPLQYTGLKDRNGKEIYEGDVVRATETSVNGSIVFHCGRFCWTDGACHWDIVTNESDGVPEVFMVARRNMEIIGNIYENPELLPQ